MMNQLSESELKSFLGRRISDAYGRNLGRIIGVKLNNFGEMEEVELEKGSGELDRIPVEQLTINGEGMTAISKWKVEVESLMKEIDSAQRRLNALSTLTKGEEMPKSLYEELLRKQEADLTNLKEKKSLAVKVLQSRSRDLDRQVEELTKTLIEIRAGKWSSDFSKKAYEVASKSIEPNLEFVTRERKELASYLEKLTKLL